MKPFETLSLDVLRDVQGVASDLDDTLTVHGALTVSSLEALGALHKHDVPCVVVTGRPLGWAEILAGFLPVRAVVAENGGVWVSRRKGVREVHYVDTERVRREGMERVRACAEKLLKAFAGLSMVRELAVRHTDLTLDVGEFVRVDASVVAAAESFAREHGVHVVTSSIHMHLSYRAPDKFGGLCAAVEQLGLSSTQLASRWLFVGDSPNDQAAFREMDLSVGVSDVRRFEGRMEHWPKWVTRTGSGEGFADVVSRLMESRRNDEIER